MCIKCAGAMTELFPEVPDDEVGDFLMACTAFPFAEGDVLKEQLVSLRNKMKSTDYHECYGIASEDNEADMQALHEELNNVS